MQSCLTCSILTILREKRINPKGKFSRKKSNSASVSVGPAQPKTTELLTNSDIIQRVTTGIHATLSFTAEQNCLASERSSKPKARKR